MAVHDAIIKEYGSFGYSSPGLTSQRTWSVNGLCVEGRLNACRNRIWLQYHRIPM